MRRIVMVALSTLTVVVLLFSYRTSTDSTLAASSPAAGGSNASSGGSAGSSSTPSPTSGSGSSSTRSSSASGTTHQYTGGVAQTRWGPVQVRISVRSGKITAAEAVQYPQGNGRDAQINSYALPILAREVVQRQSPSIDTVSGATVTSDGYLESLQSAIDAAHL